jgi:dTDP-4-dehydrorhamnose reductase
MPKVAVIGSNGMLGQAVSATQFEGYEVVEVNRIASPVFASNQHVQIGPNLLGLETSIDLNEVEVVVNCAGLIRQKIDERDPEAFSSAMAANYNLPKKILSLSEKYNFKVLQIGTDCVFSGTKGSYLETDPHDATDLYGKSKSIGEIPHRNLKIIRASIVGLESKTTKSLLSWFLSQPKGQAVNGYIDQQWNGVSVFHFTRFLKSIIESQNLEILSSVQHVVPADTVSKATLLRYFAEAFGRQDIDIRSVYSGTNLDMTLATINKNLNSKLWQMAGYPGPLSIKEMIIEYSRITTSGGNCGIK